MSDDLSSADPCLARLLSSLGTREDLGLDDPTVEVYPPVALTGDRQLSTGCNTAVTLSHATGEDAVEITYIRHSLAELAKTGGPVLIGFVPPQGMASAALVAAISAHYGRHMALRDFDISSWTTLTPAPNGIYTLDLKASAHSYGWVDQIQVPIRINADLSRAVTALGGFTFGP